MYDVTKETERKKFSAKEFAVSWLVGGMPAILLGTATHEPMVTFVLILICAQMVSYYRKKKGYLATWKTILYAVVANIVVFMLFPVIVLVVTT